MDFTYVLPIDGFRLQSECGCPRRNISRSRLGVVGIFRVQIVFADVNYWQLPQLRDVHHFIQNALAQRSFTEEADGHAISPQALGRQRRARSDSDTPRNNGIRSEISGSRIGNMHRATLAFAIASFFPQQLGKHAVWRRPFGKTMAVATMRAGNVVVTPERFANSDCDGFLTDVEA